MSDEFIRYLFQSEAIIYKEILCRYYARCTQRLQLQDSADIIPDIISHWLTYTYLNVH